MKQSTVIFGVLIFAFIVFVTVRGDLPQWLALFTAKGGTSNVTDGGPGGNGGSSIKDTAEGVLGTSGSGSTLGKVADVADKWGGYIPGAGSVISGVAKVGKLLGKFF